MYLVYCINIPTGQEFVKEFEFYDDFRKFLHKCKYSRKIKVTSWSKT